VKPDAPHRGRKPRKVCFLGNFGQGNLGNEATLRAILHRVRCDLPDAEITCICTGPEAAEKIHDVGTASIHALYIAPDFLHGTRIARWLRKIVIGVPLEMWRWIAAFRTLHGADLLIVPGTQFLSDNLTGALGAPYQAFRWCLCAWLRRCTILFVSAGIGPLRHPLSRFFARSALRFAAFRSYRDDESRRYAQRVGVDSTGDPVYPDLVFSLFKSPPPSAVRDNVAALTVAVGVIDYHGQFDHASGQDAGDIYTQYIARLATFIAWLLDHSHTVRIVIGDMTYDPPVLADLGEALKRLGVPWTHARLVHNPITSVEQLISELDDSDVVVSSRFHNVILGLMLNKPVIAISYHGKFAAVLQGAPELASYNVDIASFDVEILTSKLDALRACRQNLAWQIHDMADRHGARLEEQYARIFPWRQAPAAQK
jgi:polysaccharide pyruvyl transferase WcaK-like protein